MTQEQIIKMNKFVYVVNWGKHYSEITKWNDETHKKELLFPIKTKLPDYCGIDHHWKHIYEPNFTLKGTINKREPKKLVDKIPMYKNYKWEIIEVFKHPKAGEYVQSLEVREKWPDLNDKFTEENLLLLASTHTDKDWMKCYIVIEESGVSELSPEQYQDQQFNAFIEANLGKWDRNTLIRKDIPKKIISKFYDEDDRVLFGSSTIKGLVSYEYLEGKFSTDGKHIYLGSSILYDGEGNNKCPNPELIKPFNWIKKYIEN